MLASQSSVLAGGRPVARVGDSVMCLTHGVSRIVTEDPTRAYAGGRPLARIGDRTECGAVIYGRTRNVIAGSPDLAAP